MTTPGRGAPARSRDRLWLAGVLAAAVLLTALAARWTQHMWSFTLDEFLFRGTAGWVPDHLPGSLTDTATYQRGTQRLSEWVQAVALRALGSPDGFRAARWVFALAFASTVAPVWLLARGAGASRGWAAIGALLAILVPWAILSGTFLTEPLAYPLFAWAMLAFWWCAVRGGPRADALALAAIAAAALARTGMLVLPVALAFVVVGQELRMAGRGRPANVVRALAERHATLLAAAAVAAIALLAVGTGRLRGSWYESAGPDPARLFDAIATVVPTVAIGLGPVALIAALGLAVTQLVRAEAEERVALALVVLAGLGFVLVTAISGPDEERYVFYWAAPCAAAFAVAASRRAVAWWGLAAGTALVAWLVLRRSWWPGAPDFTSHLLFPAETWYRRVVRLGLAERTGVDADVIEVLVLLAAALLAAAFTLPLPGDLARRPAVRLAGFAAGGALLAAGAVQAGWTLHGYRAAGGGWRPVEAQAWVDRAARGATVGLWLSPAATDLAPWQAVRYFNLDVRQPVWIPPAQGAPQLPGDRAGVTAAVDPATGRVRGSGAVPPMVVTLGGHDSAPPRGAVIARGPDWGMRLIRPSLPVAVRRVQLAGPPDGRLGAGQELTVRAFAPYGARPACLRVVLRAGDRDAAARLAAPGVRRRAAAGRGGTTAVLVPLHGRRHTDVVVRALTPTGPAGSPGALSVAAEGPAGCAGAVPAGRAADAATPR